MPYEVTFRSAAARAMEKLPSQMRPRVLSKATSLADEPRPPGCSKLAGATNLWRVRVGDWRIIYAIDDVRRTVDIRIIAHRREVYRGL